MGNAWCLIAMLIVRSASTCSEKTSRSLPRLIRRYRSVASSDTWTPLASSNFCSESETLNRGFHMSDKREAMVMEAQQSTVRPHQPGQNGFRAILSEDIDWKPFPAFPPSARLAVIVGQPSEPGLY